VTSAFESSILARVTAAIQHTTFMHDDGITPQSRFDEDLGLDRLEVMEVMIHIEDVFDTEFPTEAIVQFESVPDVVRYLSRRFFPDAAELADARSS
jgi:acyl carrier protein